VQVGVTVAVDLDAVVGDGAEGVLLHELDEVVLGVAGGAARLDVVGRNRRQERQAVRDVEVGDSLGVLGLQGVVPRFEVGASSGEHLLLRRRRRRRHRRVVVRDLPIARHLLPHVRETRLHRRARVDRPELERVEARVQVGVAAVEHLHAVVGDGAEGVLLHELDEVVLGVAGRAARLDVLGGDGRQERELVRHVHVGDGLRVLGLQGVVPALEVGACLVEHVGGRRPHRRVVVRDLPIAVDLLPHVREARLHRRARARVAELERVQARVQVGVTVAVDLDAVVGDGAEGVLLHELDEVVLGAAGGAARLDVGRRHRRQEGKLVVHVKVGDDLGVLGLQGVVPHLEVRPGRRDGGHVRGGWGRRRSGGRRSGSGGVVLKDHAERDQAGHGSGNSAGVDHLDSGGTGAQRTGARRHI